MNFWDNLMGSDEVAGEYMLSYGEGPGAETRRQLGNFINDGETVLDVGCGPGWNLDHFVDHGPKIKKYLGLDYSERFVRGATLRAVGKIHEFVESGIEFGEDPPYQKGDVRNIEQPDSSWDVVIMQDVLEHTNGYEKPVKEAVRVMKKRAIFTFWHLMDKEEDNPVNDDGDDGWGAWYSKSKFEKYLDTLDLHWLHHQFNYPANRVRDFYIVDKEVKHGV